MYILIQYIELTTRNNVEFKTESLSWTYFKKHILILFLLSDKEIKNCVQIIFQMYNLEHNATNIKVMGLTRENM